MQEKWHAGVTVMLVCATDDRRPAGQMVSHHDRWLQVKTWPRGRCSSISCWQTSCFGCGVSSASAWHMATVRVVACWNHLERWWLCALLFPLRLYSFLSPSPPGTLTSSHFLSSLSSLSSPLSCLLPFLSLFTFTPRLLLSSCSFLCYRSPPFPPFLSFLPPLSPSPSLLHRVPLQMKRRRTAVWPVSPSCYITILNILPCVKNKTQPALQKSLMWPQQVPEKTPVSSICVSTIRLLLGFDMEKIFLCKRRCT